MSNYYKVVSYGPTKGGCNKNVSKPPPFQSCNPPTSKPKSCKPKSSPINNCDCSSCNQRPASPPPCSCECEQEWPPAEPTEVIRYVSPNGYKGLPTLEEVLDELQTISKNIDHLYDAQKNFEYYIYLQPNCSHILSKEYNFDIEGLSIIGDNNKPVGVYYGHKCSIQTLSTNYTENLHTNINGLGPYMVQVDGKKLIVNGARDPNFNNIKKGDTLVFFHLNGIFTCHCVSYACDNVVQLKNHIDFKHKKCSKGCDSDDEDECSPCAEYIETGQGFYIKPSTTLCITKCLNIVSKNESLKFIGLNIEAKNINTPTIKSNGDAVFLQNCVLIGNLGFNNTAVNWESPNTLRGNIYFDHSNGEIHNLSSLDDGAIYCNSTHNQKFLTCDIIDSCGLYLTNAGDATLQNSFVFKNDKALCLSHKCTSNISGTLFMCNKVAIVGLDATICFGGNDGFPNNSPFFKNNDMCVDGSTYGVTFAGNNCTFQNNNTCLTLNTKSIFDVDNLYIDNNNTEMIVDGTNYTFLSAPNNLNHIKQIDTITNL